MVIFHSYVSLPEGIIHWMGFQGKIFTGPPLLIWLVVEPTPLKNHGVSQLGL